MWMSRLLAGMVRVVVGAQPRWLGCKPAPGLRLYYANHTSHFDAPALWSPFPTNRRAKTGPDAAGGHAGAAQRQPAEGNLPRDLPDHERGQPPVVHGQLGGRSPGDRRRRSPEC